MKEYILFVGNPLPRRHLKETREAVARFPNLELTIVEDRVTDAELANLYKHARALVYVSDIEAFGLPPLEALAQGTVPIVADTPVSHELLGDDAIFCEGTVDGIADGIRRALQKQIQPTNKYSWATYAENFVSLCKTIVSQ